MTTETNETTKLADKLDNVRALSAQVDDAIKAQFQTNADAANSLPEIMGLSLDAYAEALPGFGGDHRAIAARVFGLRPAAVKINSLPQQLTKFMQVFLVADLWDGDGCDVMRRILSLSKSVKGSRYGAIVKACYGARKMADRGESVPTDQEINSLFESTEDKLPKSRADLLELIDKATDRIFDEPTNDGEPKYTTPLSAEQRIEMLKISDAVERLQAMPKGFGPTSAQIKKAMAEKAKRDKRRA
jgi:hypothetical protein